MQTLSSNVRFEDDEVVISIDGQLDLSISKSPYSDDTKKEEMVDDEEEVSTTQQIMSRTIDLSLRLLLIQRHRYNLWKVRARTLSSNHKIHQLLIQNDPLLNPSASAAVAPNPTNSASGSAVSTPTASGGPVSNNSNANAAAAAANAMRSRSRLLQSSAAVELPKEIPILSPILNFTRFWVQFDRIRHVVNSLVTPFCKYGGVPLSVHFKVSDALKQNKPKSAYDAYPAYGELALSLGITIQKR